MERLTAQGPSPSPYLSPFLQRLGVLYDQMDAAYRAAAEPAGFVCRGCARNCCRSLFFHHTYAEWVYLQSGLEALPLARRQALAAAARDYLVRKQPGDGLFCPLGDADRCSLYDHRPMICRLHGLPHVLVRPDGCQVEGPGCDDYYRQRGPVVASALNRTPFYAAMAALEKELRHAIGLSARLKMTVAEMVATPLPVSVAAPEADPHP